MSALPVIDQAEGLIRELEEQAADERRAILDAAEREALSIVRQAHAAARERVRQELLALRREADRRLARAAAQFDTDRRQREQARAAEILQAGYPELFNQVVERWADPGARRLWIASMAADASKRLRVGAWVVETPADWRPEDGEQLRALLPPAASLTFVGRDDIDAGFRIECGGASLDGTPERLLADKSVTQARLLAEMAPEVDNAATQARNAILNRGYAP